ncbi:hypothetical protein ABIB35_001500 [Arthrobacter sp. UYP6]|uniref:hypothetical protein n=1 Tax=Arthrobacter sp. UYP6 TaxID=1756378 RepID=UPI00339090FA
MSKLITESTVAPTKTGPGRVLLELITPGQGSSGYYSPEVLEQAAKDKVFPRGTQSHINHDTEPERHDRPAGDLRNLVGVTLEDAYIKDGKLVAETRISSAWKDFVEEFHEFIGASINAQAEVSEDGLTIERILPSPFNRVDFVTVAGRGGRVAEVLESAKVIENRSIRATETTANDVESYLRAAVRDAHRTEDDYAWMQDYDDAAVYFDKQGRTFKQAYSIAGVNVTLQGEPLEVRRRVEYDPVSVPAAESAPKDSPPNPAGVTENRKEPIVATTNIEESELSALRADASRAAALEADNKALREAAVKAEAAKIVAEAFDGVEAPKTAARLAESFKLTADGQLDAAALKAEAEESAAEWKVAHGAGSVTGVGDTTSVTESKTRTDDDIINALGGN